MPLPVRWKECSSCRSTRTALAVSPVPPLQLALLGDPARATGRDLLPLPGTSSTAFSWRRTTIHGRSWASSANNQAGYRFTRCSNPGMIMRSSSSQPGWAAGWLPPWRSKRRLRIKRMLVT